MDQLSRIGYFVIILNFNSSKDTVSLYKDLISYGMESKAILVIDNHSKPFEIEYLKENIPQNRLILNEKNHGYAGGNNIGIACAIKEGARYIWILNPDIRVEPETIDVLLAFIESDEKLAAVGARTCERARPTKIYYDGGYINATDHYKVTLRNFGRDIHECDDEDVEDVDYVVGSCILMRLETVRSIGAFNETFFLYYEEADWCLRAKKRGWKLGVTTRTTVYHAPSEKKQTYHYYMSRNRIRFIKLHSNSPTKHISYYFKKMGSELLRSVRTAKLPQNYYWTRLKGMLIGIFPERLFESSGSSAFLHGRQF